MDQLELKKIKKIYNEINSIAKVGKNNYLEYFYYVDDLINKSQYSLLNTCLLLNYGIDYTQYNSIYDLKNLTWDIICFQTLTPLDERLKKLYEEYDIYQLGRDIYSNDLSYYDIKISLPISYTQSYTKYTSQFNIYENNGEINIRLIDTNLYQIEIYKDYLIQVITSGTYSTLYDVNIDNLKISKDVFKTLIPMDSGSYNIITYTRNEVSNNIIQIPNTIYQYNLNIDIKNKLGTINEIDSDDYFSGLENTYYNKYLNSHFNKNEQIDNTLGLKRTFLNVIKYGNVNKEINVIQVNPYYSENLNLYWRYVSAIEFLVEKNRYKSRTLNQNIHAVWNSESIMYSLYNLLYGAWNASSLRNSEYGDFNMQPIGDVTLERIGVLNKNGLPNYVYNFNSAYFKLPDDSLKLTGNFCINIRIFISDFKNQQKILSCYNKYQGDIYGWYIEINKNFNLELNDCELSFNVRMNDYKMYKAICYIPTELINKQNPNNINTWINITINYNKNGYIAFYINGEYLNEYFLNTKPLDNAENLSILYTNLNKCSIGSGLFLKDQEENIIPTNTKIDSLYIWSRNLLNNEILSIYNKGESLEFPFSNLIESSNDWLNAFNATMSNVTIDEDGKVSKCFLFGNQSYISLPNNSLNINNFDNFSLSMWINFKEVGMTQSILCCKDNNNNGYDFILDNQNIINIRYKNNNYSFNTTGPKLNKNSWYLLNVTISKDINKNILNLYVNTVNYLKNVIIDNISNLLNIKPKIGVSLNNGAFNNYISNGSKVDSITIWNKILNDDDIKFLYNDGVGVEYPFTVTDKKKSDKIEESNYSTYQGEADVQNIGESNDVPNESNDVPNESNDVPNESNDVPNESNDIPNGSDYVSNIDDIIISNFSNESGFE